jgi:hypothetical protein
LPPSLAEARRALVAHSISGGAGCAVLLVAFAAAAAAAASTGWRPIVTMGAMAAVPLTLVLSGYRTWRGGLAAPTLAAMAVACLLMLVPASILLWEVVLMDQPNWGVLALTATWWFSLLVSTLLTGRLWITYLWELRAPREL